jgi:hypothetical protein
MSSEFMRLFAGPGRDDDRGEERSGWTRRPATPPWLGPPEDVLGAIVPLALVVGRSENAVVALRHATVAGEGVALQFVAAARGLRDARASRLMHDQHVFDPEDEPSDALLRLGLELPDGRRVSNLDRRRGPAGWASIETRPNAPVFFPHGGGGGSSGNGRVSMQPAYWLWPLPDSGAIRIFCEWPAVDLPLSSAELDVAPLVEARERIVPLWPG